MKILILNGPNLNLLGLREPDIYGRQTYAALEDFCRAAACEAGCELEIRQTNHVRIPLGEILVAGGDVGDKFLFLFLGHDFFPP